MRQRKERRKETASRSRQRQSYRYIFYPRIQKLLTVFKALRYWGRTLNTMKIVPDMEKLRLVEELLRYVMDAKEV